MTSIELGGGKGEGKEEETEEGGRESLLPDDFDEQESKEKVPGPKPGIPKDPHNDER